MQAMYHALPQEGSDSLELELQDSCRGCWEQNAGLDFCGILFMHVYTYMYMLWHGCGVRGEHFEARVSFHHGDPAMELRLQSAAGSFPC